MRQLIATDLAYFPERLYRMIIINSPWYFPALYNMFKPFIDPRTREKIVILGTDYQSVLAEYADPADIPSDYGGENSSIDWGSSSFADESGLSLAQLESKQLEQLEHRSVVLTPQEMQALHKAFSHPRYMSAPNTVHKREVLEAWMQSAGVEPLRELEMEAPAEEPGLLHSQDDRSSDSSPGGGGMSLQTALQNKDTLFAMPQLQVCDVLTTGITGIEVII